MHDGWSLYLLINFIEGEVKTEAGDAVKLEDIMQFFTGSRAEPPLGFSRKPAIKFIEGNLAMANTCFYWLQLPFQHSNYMKFRQYMILSIRGHIGFGLA